MHGLFGPCSLLAMRLHTARPVSSLSRSNADTAATSANSATEVVFQHDEGVKESCNLTEDRGTMRTRRALLSPGSSIAVTEACEDVGDDADEDAGEEAQEGAVAADGDSTGMMTEINRDARHGDAHSWMQVDASRPWDEAWPSRGEPRHVCG